MPVSIVNQKLFSVVLLTFLTYIMVQLTALTSTVHRHQINIGAVSKVRRHQINTAPVIAGQPPSPRYSSKHTACPVMYDYKAKECSIKLMSPPCDNDCRMRENFASFSMPRKFVMRALGHHTSEKNGLDRGVLLLNQKLAFTWEKPRLQNPYVLFFLIDDSCSLVHHSVIYLSKTRNSSFTYLQYFLNNSRTDVLLAGVLNGPLYQATDAFQNIIPLPDSFTRYIKGNKAIVAFVARRGYLGHTVTAISGLSGRKAVLEKVWHFGVPYNVNLSSTNYTAIRLHHADMSLGGQWKPRDCVSLWRLAIIIPYRKREAHLLVFLKNILPFLKLQRVQFRIFIVEQTGKELFNRAALMNAGYIEAKKLGHFNCYIFHDVDLMPLDLTNIYSCAEQPRHLMVSRSTTQYIEAIYTADQYSYFGGVIAMTPLQIDQINGFPNDLFGWGGEDDEMITRITLVGLKVLKYPHEVAHYRGILHDQDEGNPHMKMGLGMFQNHARKHLWRNGLNTVNYSVLSVHKTSLFTCIKVVVPGPTTALQQLLYLKQYDSHLSNITEDNFEQYLDGAPSNGSSQFTNHTQHSPTNVQNNETKSLKGQIKNDHTTSQTINRGRNYTVHG